MELPLPSHVEDGRRKREREACEQRRVAWHTTSTDRYTQPSVGTVSQPETPDPTPVRSAVINRRQSARVGHAAIPASTQHMRANCELWRTPTWRSQLRSAQKPDNRKFCQRIEPAKFLLNLPQPEHTNYTCNVDTPVSNTKSRRVSVLHSLNMDVSAVWRRIVVITVIWIGNA